MTFYIFNFLASTSALIDSCRSVMNFYKNTEIHEHYTKNIKEQFANNSIAVFIKDLRNYQMHYKTTFPYNLDFYNTTEEKDEEHPSKRFCFLTKKDAENGNYYKVKEILAYDASRKFIDSMIRRNFHEKCQDDLKKWVEQGKDFKYHVYLMNMEKL